MHTHGIATMVNRSRYGLSARSKYLLLRTTSEAEQEQTFLLVGQHRGVSPSL
jgi:hypothetical protein